MLRSSLDDCVIIRSSSSAASNSLSLADKSIGVQLPALLQFSHRTMGKGTCGNPPMLLACMTRGSGEGGGPGWPVTTAMTTSGGDGENEVVTGTGSEGEGDISVEPILIWNSIS